MIKAVIFDFDNTLMDFMRMKKAAVETAVDAMIDAGLTYQKAEMIEKIYKGYALDGIEDQQIFDKVLLKEFGKIDYKILGAGIIGYRRGKEGTLALYPHVQMTLMGLARLGLGMAVVSDAPRIPVWLRICGPVGSHVRPARCAEGGCQPRHYALHLADEALHLAVSLAHALQQALGALPGDSLGSEPVLHLRGAALELA